MFEHRAVSPQRRESSGLFFKRLPHLEEFLDAREGEIGDDEAAAGLRGDQSIRHQPGKGLSQWGSGNAETLGLFDLPERAAGAEFPADDLFTKDLVRAIARSLYRRHPCSFVAGMYTSWLTSAIDLNLLPALPIFCIQKRSVAPVET